MPACASLPSEELREDVVASMTASGPRDSTTIPPYITQAQSAARRSVAARRDDVEAVARAIHAHPELAGEERSAVDLMTGLLATRGFAIERGLGGIRTAFQATY